MAAGAIGGPDSVVLGSAAQTRQAAETRRQTRVQQPEDRQPPRPAEARETSRSQPAVNGDDRVHSVDFTDQLTKFSMRKLRREASMGLIASATSD